MKNFIKINILILILSLFTSTAYSDGFNSIYSQDGYFVVAAGNNGNFYRSMDGGLNYSSYPQGSGNLYSVFAIGTKVVAVGDAGKVIVSGNSGSNFTSYTFSAQNLRSVYFIDAQTGWTVGDAGTIGKTTNGGVNWSAQTSGITTNLSSVKFTSATNGVACGAAGKILYTTNGGTNWQPYTTPTTKDLMSIDMKGTTIIATGIDGFVIKYNGSVWSMNDYKIVTKSEVRSVSMIDANTYYTTGGGGFIRKTTDGGTTFSYQANPMMANTTSIYFSDANKGWVVAGTNNAILRTSNGGTSWQFQNGVNVSYNWVQKQATSGNIGNPFCLHPQNKNAVFILAGSALYKSYNKGETWILMNGSVPGSQCHSFYVNSLDTNIMIATKGSSNGRVIKSTNYGATWFDVINPINLTSYGMPLEADPNNANTLYLAPDNDSLMKSTNYGTTWTSLGGGESSNTFRSPCDVIVQFENPNIVLVADGTTGSGLGKLWRSSNGGLNWTLINTVTGSEIPMMSNTSLNLDLIYHSTWSSGSYWKSQNMGTNFANLNQSGSLWANDIPKDDPTAVCYDLYGNNAYISLDGGATFATTSVGSTPAAGMCFLDKANLLIQHGGGVFKLNITYSVVTSVEPTSTNIPDRFSLEQNYPNPFNPSTTINFNVSKPGYIKVKVYDVKGTEVAELVNSNLIAGEYHVDFNASMLTSGIYFYSMSVDGNIIDSKKMMLIK